MSIIGVPVMTKASFISSERDVGECWKQELRESTIKEEKRLAMEKNQFHKGVPAITVIVDGGWCKRSHKHSYNANSGVAIIIGRDTGKLLYFGVRNKYCSSCARGIPPEKHVCYRNWKWSSSEMETDIILEGFLEAERVHGVRYTQFIGDGDSSVYSTLLQNVPGWGHVIKKLECANHACKCYRGALERLVQDNPSYKGSGGLTKVIRKKLVTAARSAIRMHSREPDTKKALKLLKHDLCNGPQHCFGNHEHCSTDFCKTAREKSQQASSSSLGVSISLSTLLSSSASASLPSSHVSASTSASASTASASLLSASASASLPSSMSASLPSSASASVISSVMSAAGQAIMIFIDILIDCQIAWAKHYTVGINGLSFVISIVANLNRGCSSRSGNTWHLSHGMDISRLCVVSFSESSSANRAFAVHHFA